MRRVASVIDTWFDSGSMPWAQYHYPFENEETFKERFPADFICEAIDQTRGWFYTLLAESVLLFDTSSYRNVVCLGLILDPEGQKMSKSRGNVVEPWDVIAKHGADAFRWYYFASQQPWSGYRFSVDTVGDAVRHFLLTLWNTYSFWVLYANAEGSEPEALAGVWSSGERGDGSSGELDRWALSRLQRTIAEVREQMDSFDCTSAAGAIADYSEDLSNWYLRLSRRRFWDGDETAFATLRHCLITLATLLAPFTPFLADEIYTNLAVGRLAEVVASELNVKELDFVETEAELVSYRVKPNYRSLGPRFGKSMPQVAAAVEALEAAAVADALERGEEVGIQVEGKDHTLTADDVNLVMEPLEGYQVEAEAGHAVALELDLDDELLREGLAREVVRAVQEARKQAGLEVSDRIALALGGDEELLAAAREHESYIAGETLATSVDYGADGAGEKATIEGRELRIALSKA